MRANDYLFRNIKDKSKITLQIMLTKLSALEFFDDLSIGIVVSDQEGQIVNASSYILSLLNYTIEELTEMNVKDITSSEEIGMTQSVFSSLVEKEDRIQIEKKYVGKDGASFIGLSSISIKVIDGTKYFVATISDITKSLLSRKRMQIEFQNLVEGADDVIYTVDMNGNFTYVNQMAQLITGYSEEELLQMNYVDLIDEDHKQEAIRNYQEYFASKAKTNEFVLLIETKARKKVWLHQKLRTQFDDTGRIIGYQAVSRNVTDEIEMKQKLEQSKRQIEESEKYYYALFEKSTIPLWIEDFSEVLLRLQALKREHGPRLNQFLKDHPQLVGELAAVAKIIEINEQTVKLHRATDKNLLLGQLDKIVSPEAIGPLGEQLSRIAKGELHGGFHSVSKTLDGERLELEVSWSVLPGYEETWEKVIVSTIDVTEKRKIQKQIEESEEQLMAVFQNLGVPIFISDPESCEILIANVLAAKSLGYSSDELMKLRIDQVDAIHDFDYVQKALKRTLKEEHVQGESKWITKDGQIRTISIRNSLILFNKRQSVLSVCVDITEVKELNFENERFRMVMNDPPFAIYITDLGTGKLIDVNRTACKQLGYSKDEILNLHSEDIEQTSIMQSPEEKKAHFTSLIDSGKTQYIDGVHRRKDGSTFPVKVSVNARKVEDQVFLIASVFDNTLAEEADKLLKKQYEELKQFQRDLSKVNQELVEEIELRKEIQLRLYNSEEKERKRMATDLHDGLGQKLTAAKLALGAIKNSEVLQGDSALVLSDSIKIIEESMREVREISHNLTPSVLNDYGLSAALAKVCDRLRDYQEGTIDFLVIGEEIPLSMEVQTSLYRVGQEAINNARKYAQANKIIVNLSFKGDEVVLVVQDDGKGFNIDEVAAMGGTGIGNMRERCRLIKASFGLTSHLGEGTKLTISYSKTLNG